MPNAHPGWRRGIAAAVASAAVLGGASSTDAQPPQKPPRWLPLYVTVEAFKFAKPVRISSHYCAGMEQTGLSEVLRRPGLPSSPTGAPRHNIRTHDFALTISPHP